MIRSVTKTVHGRLSAFTLAFVASLALTFEPSLEGFLTRGQYALATMVLAGILWVPGVFPLAMAALSIPMLLTAYGTYSDTDLALVGFADHFIFLFIAGFMLANAPQKYSIDRRVTLWLMAVMGSSPRRFILIIIPATVFLSVWVSNIMTTTTIAPIAFDVLAQVFGHEEIYETDTTEGSFLNVRVATPLDTAYAASVGGVGTFIDTPPNAVVATQFNALLGYDTDFAEQLLVSFPVAAITLPIVWHLLTFRLYPPEAGDVEGARKQACEYLADEGALSTRGRRVAYILAVTTGLWAFGGLDLAFENVLSDQVFNTLFGTAEGATLPGVEGHQGLLYYAMVGMVPIPAPVLTDTMEWDELVDIDWEAVLLFSGDIPLADAFTFTSTIRWLVGTTLDSLTGAPIVLVVGAIVPLVIFLTEIILNTATATTTVLVLIGIGSVFAATLGLTEVPVAVFLVVSGVIAASFTSALPVATPPNATILGSDHIKQSHIMRTGVVLSVVMTGVLTILV